ncbi:hypothetical protein I6B53_04040 [Schaalia sp. 19OD2882]|uniref:hypothetical protein n=1 Tax=Schaalia sp. 19OD2882 TaxID=2794089 RepID=UPI001C1E92F8|nr:hypothetical protein [Schaalia sp. 19OD2882]QWW20270.1 hypothetical protein I6B53_04040 [Schaalia sp. 19OD2882]
MPTRPRLLILSFSPIRHDARVLKQVRMAVGRYHVTTCGFGEAPDGVDDHVQIDHSSLPGKTWDLLLATKAYRAGYWLIPDVRTARRALRGRRFDVILADDIDTVPLAIPLKPRCGIHADLHEYFPRLAEDHAPWKKRIGPWYHWLCRVHLPKVTSVTTVSEGIAREYSEQFGIEVGVVTNATPFHDLEPGSVDDPIRVVHSGTSHRERNITAIVEGVLSVPGYTLDLYLTPNDPPHLAELKQLAETESNLTVHDPVPYEQLIETLNRYDIGAFLLPASNFSFANALPNKVFDFIQARLALVVSPIPEMAKVVRDAEVGVVTDGVGAEELARALSELDREKVAVLKASSHAHARELSCESEVPKWDAALTKILRGAGVAAPEALEPPANGPGNG